MNKLNDTGSTNLKVLGEGELNQVVGGRGQHGWGGHHGGGRNNGNRNGNGGRLSRFSGNGGNGGNGGGIFIGSLNVTINVFG